MLSVPKFILKQIIEKFMKCFLRIMFNLIEFPYRFQKLGILATLEVSSLVDSKGCVNSGKM